MNSSSKRQRGFPTAIARRIAPGLACAAAAFVCALASSGALASETGEVQNVVSGDTLMVTHDGLVTILRLAGIQAPRSCNPLGQRSLRALRKAIARNPIRYERVSGSGNGMRRGTMVARVMLADGSEASVRQLENGMAWMLRSGAVDRALAAAEARARRDRIGLWREADSMPTDVTRRLASCEADSSEAEVHQPTPIGARATGASISGIRRDKADAAARSPDGSRVSPAAMSSLSTLPKQRNRGTVATRGPDGRRERPAATVPTRDADVVPAPARDALSPLSPTQIRAASSPPEREKSPRFHYAPSGNKVVDPVARTSPEDAQSIAQRHDTQPDDSR